MGSPELALGMAGLALTAATYVITQARKNESRLTALETKISVFWRVIEEGAVSLLHRDDTPRVDALLEKAAANTLTNVEAKKLIEELREIEQDRTRTKGESTAALLMRAVLIARYDG